ncbi:hypothetical protein A1O1_01323 [Capronia coronata CBS 617.96]|uniref:Uncharacterized protein n=1 Tax=Capronia coronata CBS 617.96 TaxID=1182541 RepID=W9YTG6_9EURO|nr:uncharacterized protein A1O1_01323 [Capronia coronata CBS 617.96]EXJ96197.1 hypothetical protein A1O1_01323 [Capronia coronata CBS 617.96]
MGVPWPSSRVQHIRRPAIITATTIPVKFANVTRESDARNRIAKHSEITGYGAKQSWSSSGSRSSPRQKKSSHSKRPTGR